MIIVEKRLGYVIKNDTKTLHEFASEELDPELTKTVMNQLKDRYLYWSEFKPQKSSY